VTEKGYCVDAEGELDLTNPLVKRDLADISQPASAIGYICAGLKLRMEAGKQPFTVRLASSHSRAHPAATQTHSLLGRALTIGFTRFPTPEPWSIPCPATLHP